MNTTRVVDDASAETKLATTSLLILEHIAGLVPIIITMRSRAIISMPGPLWSQSSVVGLSLAKMAFVKGRHDFNYGDLRTL